MRRAMKQHCVLQIGAVREQTYDDGKFKLWEPLKELDHERFYVRYGMLEPGEVHGHQALEPDVRMQLCNEVRFCLILSFSATWIYPFRRLHAMLCLHGRIVRDSVCLWDINT